MEKSCKIRLVEFGSIKALVSVIYGDLEIRGFKVIDQEGEAPWVAMPSREFQKGGDRQFFNIVYVPDEAKRKEFVDWIIEEYRKAEGKTTTEPLPEKKRRRRAKSAAELQEEF